MMQTKQIQLVLPREAALAFQHAPASEQERIQQMVVHALRSRQEQADDFDQYTAQLHRRTAARGLTDTDIEALLSEDEDA